MCVAACRAMPANWFGLRLSMLLRRPLLQWCRRSREGIDTEIWGLRLRLYPADNGCEKGALFTPQMYDVPERAALERAVAACADRDFVFIDVGANAGLYSFFVAAITEDRGRIVAIEPQPHMIERMTFNINVNRLQSITLVAAAVTATEGDVTLSLDGCDAGGATLRFGRPDQPRITVRGHTLMSIFSDAGITRIDALKIDIEGAEDEALMPFLAAAPATLLPRLIIIEDTRGAWKADLFGRLADLGYSETGRSKQNRILSLMS